MRKILIVIDMQNDFVTGSLGTPDAVAIVPNVIKKIKSYAIYDTFYTMDEHYDAGVFCYENVQEGKNLPIKHCIYGTSGYKLIPEIDKFLVPIHVYHKNAFASTELAQYLKEQERRFESIEIIGLVTDICVISNALMLKSFLPEVPITVDASCCAGTTVERHIDALGVMKSCQINIINE